MADLTLATSSREAIPDLRPVVRANRVMLALDLGTKTVAIDDDRLTWPERELVRQLGERLYGKREREARHG
jgi:hypothetical protein